MDSNESGSQHQLVVANSNIDPINDNNNKDTISNKSRESLRSMMSRHKSLSKSIELLIEKSMDKSMDKSRDKSINSFVDEEPMTQPEITINDDSEDTSSRTLDPKAKTTTLESQHDNDLTLESNPGHDTSDFTYNKHREGEFDDFRMFPSLKKANVENLVKFDDSNAEIINHATLKALIVQQTSPDIIDYDLISDFFLTYRMFSKASIVLDYLVIRLIWSLQYINSTDVSSQKIGQLVLLRTFVVLRHWILNYFVDDFNNDLKLCDYFILSLNDIMCNSQLVNPNMIFERKILKDLKCHWIKQTVEFWKIDINIDINSDQQVWDYKLPMTNELSTSVSGTLNKLTKSNTEQSLHTNASYRRSAMLSLYDQKTHHKCLIPNDNNSSSANPQFSINNLIGQHKSSRLSINNKLQKFHLGNSPNSSDNNTNHNKHKQTPLTPSSKQNRINFNDSSLGLKKVTPNELVPQTSQNRNHLEVPLNPLVVENIGFSTNGGVKLPSSKVTAIIPSTPVRKMEYVIRNPNKPPSVVESESDFESLLPVKPPPIKNMEVKRKNSFKDMVNNWKNSIYHKPDNKELNDLIGHAVNPGDDDENNEDDTIGNRIDVLSARIVDELEYLIRSFIQGEPYTGTIIENSYEKSKTFDNDQIDTGGFDEQLDITNTQSKEDIIINEPDPDSPLQNKFKNVDENANDEEEEDEEEEVDINDLSDINLQKIDNIVNERERDNMDDEEEFNDTQENFDNDVIIPPDVANNRSPENSFQRPTSISWNDDADMDESKNNDNIDDTNNMVFPEPNLQFLNSNDSMASTISTPSNITQYDAEIEDLGIAVSPLLMKEQQMKRRTITDLSARFSKNSSNSIFKRDSAKSYISYDSAFSVSHDDGRLDENQGNLRKKAGHNSLRRLAGGPVTSPKSLNERNSLDQAVRIESDVSTSSVRKSIRFSAVNALVELPFNGQNDSKNSISLAKGDINEYRSSIFSVGNVRNSISNSAETLNEESESSSPKVDANDTNGSVAIPGISDNVLQELAAIPDHTYSSNDPIDYAFGRLAGSGINGLTGSNHSEETQVGDDLGLLKVEDIDNDNSLEVGSNKAVARETLLTPIKKSRSLEHATSTPDASMTRKELNDIVHDSKTETDHVFIFSTNYGNAHKSIRSPAKTEILGSPSKTKRISGSKSDHLSLINKNHRMSSRHTHIIASPSKTSFITNNRSPRKENQNDSEFDSSQVERSPHLILAGYNLNDNLLSIERVMNGNLHISFVLSYSSDELAHHFTVIERDILQEIDWKDLIELKWNKELNPVNSWLEIIVNETYYNSNKGVNLVISRFNLMVNWIISEILLTRDETERIHIISRFIHIGQHCLTIQNYATLMQVILALTSEKISKLKHTLRQLPPGDLLILNNLEELSSPLKNFLNLRLSINEIKPSKGCIPFVGLYLSDLIFNTERPKFINDEVINFSRFRTSVHIVKSLSQCIEWSSYYNYPINNELLSKCLYIRSLDEDEMNYCLSNHIYP